MIDRYNITTTKSVFVCHKTSPSRPCPRPSCDTELRDVACHNMSFPRPLGVRGLHTNNWKWLRMRWKNPTISVRQQEFEKTTVSTHSPYDIYRPLWPPTIPQFHSCRQLTCTIYTCQESRLMGHPEVGADATCKSMGCRDDVMYRGYIQRTCV